MNETSLQLDHVAYVPEELRAQKSALADGQKPRATVRELLGWFGAARRGLNVVQRIRTALEEVDLVTWPHFEGEYIDQEVLFMDKRSFQPPRPPQPPDPENDGEAVVAGHDCVLVRDRENKITGLVTGTDISEQFHLLAEPFLLLEEIEKRIRALILRRFSLEDLQAAKNAADADRKISDVSDLSFGEYVRLLENENRWHKLQLKVDRVKFIEQLSRIRDIRNDVMHFDPDGVTDDALDDLRRFSRFLDRIQMLIH